MNMSFVDLARVPRATIGSRVTLIGSDGNATIEAEELAIAANTIGYEITTRLPSEVPRRLV